MPPLFVRTLVVAIALGCAGYVEAQDATSRSWREEKCFRYKKAWDELSARRGTTGLGEEFLARHAAFIAEGCTGAADVCPRSQAELDVANIMIVAAMNAGTASTFPPFACWR